MKQQSRDNYVEDFSNLIQIIVDALGNHYTNDSRRFDIRQQFYKFSFREFCINFITFYSIAKAAILSKENAKYTLRITVRKVFSYTKIYSFLRRYDTGNNV